MTIEEIEVFIDASAAAIARARKAGFDAVQLHAAHGWLLSSFLSAHTNRRTDIYGGNTQNRARIMTEIIRRSRELAGKDFPVFAKINACDYVEGGINLPEALVIGKILEDAGYAALEVNSSMWETATRKPKDVGGRRMEGREAPGGAPGNQIARARGLSPAVRQEFQAKLKKGRDYSYRRHEDTAADGRNH